jgi:hypothetical protein
VDVDGARDEGLGSSSGSARMARRRLRREASTNE